MKKFKAAIFDMDGTLLDTMYIWRNLVFEYCQYKNVKFPEDKIGTIPVVGLAQAADYLIHDFHLDLTPQE